MYKGPLVHPDTRARSNAFVANVQRRVTGTVRLKLFKGDGRVVGGSRRPRSSIPACYARRRRQVRPQPPPKVREDLGLPVETAARKAGAGTKRVGAGPQPAAV